MKSSRITYRQARATDMPDCVRVFKRSATDLARRHGEGPPQIRARDMVRALSHLQGTDPKGFHVAIQDGRVVSFASTILRGNTHFLAMFWTLPSLQSKGVGRRVLTRAFEVPRPPASAIRCVYASLDMRAQALYLKFGMRPRGLFYLLRGAPKRSPRPKRAVELVPMGKVGEVSPKMLTVAARFDRMARAARRDADIRHIMSLPGARFYLARRGSTTLGYAVVSDKGRVGPAYVTDPRDSAGVAWAAKEIARERKAENVTVIVPGVNAGALDVFFRSGLKTVFFGAWMSAKPLGSFEAYLLAAGILL